MQLEIHQQKAIEFLLRNLWIEEKLSEASSLRILIRPTKFETESEWLKWLYRRKFISKEHLDIQLEELKKEEDNGTTT